MDIEDDLNTASDVDRVIWQAEAGIEQAPHLEDEDEVSMDSDESSSSLLEEGDENSAPETETTQTNAMPQAEEQPKVIDVLETPKAMTVDVKTESEDEMVLMDDEEHIVQPKKTPPKKKTKRGSFPGRGRRRSSTHRKALTQKLPSTQTTVASPSPKKAPQEQSQPQIDIQSLMNNPKVYRMAREHLVAQRYFKRTLPTRDDEFKTVLGTVAGCFSAKTSTVLFIYGLPGTGKTATVHAVMRALEEKTKPGVRNKLEKFIYCQINALKFAEPNRTFVEFWKSLSSNLPHLKSNSSSSPSVKESIESLSRYFRKADPEKPMTVLLLDEIDYLTTRKQEVIYQYLEWAQEDQSRLVLIGIANTFHLPETLFGKIHSRMGVNRLAFEPYKGESIERILKFRFGEYSALFEEHSLTILAMRAAQNTADVRQVMHMARRALTFAENENNVLNKPKRSPPPDYKVMKVTLQHCVNALADLKKDIKQFVLPSLADHEKLFLFAVVLERERLQYAPVLSNVINRYHTLCHKESKFKPGNMTMLNSVLSSLVDMSYIKLFPPSAAGARVEEDGQLAGAGGLAQQLDVTMPKDDILTALRDDEIAAHVFGRRLGFEIDLQL